MNLKKYLPKKHHTQYRNSENKQMTCDWIEIAGHHILARYKEVVE